MKKLVYTLCCLWLCFGADAQLNTTLESTTSYGSTRLSDVWGYAAGGREYALVALRNGVNILDITNPAGPIDKGTATGPNSTWRDVKTFGSYAYVTNETGDGLLIIDLSNLPNTLPSSDWSYWEPNISDLGGTLSTCHNIYIDGSGYGYLAGCNRNGGGVIYIDLFSTPGSPQYVDKAPNTYAHDVYVQDNIMYTSDINAGKLTLYNVANKTSTIFLGDQVTPEDFTHNAWADGSGNTVFTTDEVANAPVAAYDISDPNNISLLDEFRPLETINTGVIPHNVHVLNDYLIISHYTDGVIIVDASVPSNLIEVGNYDTHSPNNTGFRGAWGAYPFLPSGNILVSDINNGCFVIAPTYVRAARLKGGITDSQNGANLSGVKVTISSLQANEDISTFDCAYKTGIATAGTYDVTFEKAGYNTLTVSTSLSNGTETLLNVQLVSLALAVELYRFEASLSAPNEVSLQWEASSDDAFVEFRVERSADGGNLEKIGTVLEEAPSLFAQAYDFVDPELSDGEWFYRLAMVDPAGSISYSPVRTVQVGKGAGKAIQLFPNPSVAGQTLEISRSEDLSPEPLDLYLYDATGRQIDYVQLLREESNHSYSNANLSSGLYFLRVMQNGQTLQTERWTIH